MQILAASVFAYIPPQHTAIIPFLTGFKGEVVHSVGAVHCAPEWPNADSQATPLSKLPCTGVLSFLMLYSNKAELQCTRKYFVQSSGPQVEGCGSMLLGQNWGINDVFRSISVLTFSGAVVGAAL